jgi:hypothetical protein
MSEQLIQGRLHISWSFRIWFDFFRDRIKLYNQFQLFKMNRPNGIGPNGNSGNWWDDFDDEVPHAIHIENAADYYTLNPNNRGSPAGTTDGASDDGAPPASDAGPANNPGPSVVRTQASMTVHFQDEQDTYQILRPLMPPDESHLPAYLDGTLRPSERASFTSPIRVNGEGDPSVNIRRIRIVRRSTTIDMPNPTSSDLGLQAPVNPRIQALRTERRDTHVPSYPGDASLHGHPYRPAAASDSDENGPAETPRYTPLRLHELRVRVSPDGVAYVVGPMGIYQGGQPVPGVNTEEDLDVLFRTGLPPVREQEDLMNGGPVQPMGSPPAEEEDKGMPLDD